jgi:deoxyadenosine/deoxycytidine kinase
MNTPITTITIEGNIGSGKSTLLNYLRSYVSDYSYVDEPLSKWDQFQDASGKTILQKFYEDQHRYAFSFQTMALLSRLTSIRTAIEEQKQHNVIFPKPIVTERSLFTDKCVFATMLFKSGKIEDINYQIYLSWFDTFIKECPIDLVVYVKTDPAICRKRISKRLREGEEGIPIEYLQQCDEYHEKMIDELNRPTLILDGNQDMDENPDLLESWKHQIQEFIIRKTIFS